MNNTYEGFSQNQIRSWLKFDIFQTASPLSRLQNNKEVKEIDFGDGTWWNMLEDWIKE